MRRFVFFLCIGIIQTCLVLGNDIEPKDLEGRVVDLALDQKKPPVIKVGTRNITTIEFPAKIEAMEGYGFFIPSKETPVPPEGALFQISYNKGTNFFSVRAIGQGAAGNLTIVLGQKAYCLVLMETLDSSFIVVFNDGSSGPQMVGSVAAQTPPPPAAKKLASPERLSGLLDKAKGFSTLRNSAAEMYQGIAVAEPNKKANIDDDVLTTLKRVLRDDGIDSLAFEVEISNKSKGDFYYDPEGFAARVGGKLFTESIADASGVVPAGKAETVFFCVTGDGQGGRNDLAPSNAFDIDVRKIQGERTAPIGWAEPPDSLPGDQTLPAKQGEPSRTKRLGKKAGKRLAATSQ
jgi:hypothetical protein